MFIIAMAFISLGYTLGYWGGANIKHWNRSVTDTEAVPLKMLFGFDMGKTSSLHPIPFPYNAPAASTPDGSNASKSPKPLTPGASGYPPGGLSPNYPGAPGSTIPNPTIPTGGTKNV